MLEKTKDMKPIHFHVYNPTRMSLFKTPKSTRAKSFVVSCNNSDNCELYKRGQCMLRASFGSLKCPYGRQYSSTGYTSRAKGFYSWIRKQEETYKGVGSLSGHSKVMAIVDDYLILPYAHLQDNKDLENIMVDGSCHGTLVKLDLFNADIVISIVEYRPQALFGGEITSYQKEEIPLFLKHLSEQMPEIFKLAKSKSKKIAEIAKTFSNIGRKARLRSLNINIGRFVDIHKATWVWDGEYLISKDSHASFMLVSKFSELRIKPEGDPEVKITDEKQVNENTIFLS